MDENKILVKVNLKCEISSKTGENTRKFNRPKIEHVEITENVVI